MLRFHGRTPRARRLRSKADVVRGIVEQFGGSHVRVFGSLATGIDSEESDIDLLFTMGRPLSLMELGELERQLSEALQAPVDILPDTALRPPMRERILAEAIKL